MSKVYVSIEHRSELRLIGTLFPIEMTATNLNSILADPSA